MHVQDIATGHSEDVSGRISEYSMDIFCACCLGCAGDYESKLNQKCFVTHFLKYFKFTYQYNTHN